jgi:hypothetical protein
VLGQQAHGAPGGDQSADSQEPVCPYGSELAGLALRSSPSLVLDDREQVSQHHCSAECKGHLLDKKVEVDELFHCRDASDSSGKSMVGYAQWPWEYDNHRSTDLPRTRALDQLP